MKGTTWVIVIAAVLGAYLLLKPKGTGTKYKVGDSIRLVGDGTFRITDITTITGTKWYVLHDDTGEVPGDFRYEVERVDGDPLWSKV